MSRKIFGSYSHTKLPQMIPVIIKAVKETPFKYV